MTIIDSVRPAPTPAAVPRARHPQLHAFDLVSEISPTGVAWAGRDAATGEMVVRLNARERGEEVLPALTERVARWVDAHRDGDLPVKLRCFSLALRDTAAAGLDPERFVIADPIELNSTRSWAEDARVMLRERLAERDRQVFTRSTLYAASDGSVHPAYGNGAFAWVTSDGTWAARRAPDRILNAEVAGIVSFARHFVATGTHYRAVLFVDSLASIDILVDGKPAKGVADAEGVELVRSLIAADRLELIWVRGHDGHLLNDVADRLALLRHRAVRMQLSPQQVNASGERIVAEAIDRIRETDWAQQARRARDAHTEHVRQHVAVSA